MNSDQTLPKSSTDTVPPAPNTFAAYATSRENNFDFLRFALATAVVFAHGFHTVNRTRVFYDPLLVLTHDQMQLGHLAVAGFFAISGFLITQSLERSPTFGDYLRKRVLRIYPGFVACWLVCILVVAPLSGLTWEHYVSQVNIPWWILKIVTLHGFGGYVAFPFNATQILNTSLWTIPYEFGCYLMLAAIGAIGWLRPGRTLLLTGLVYVSLAFGAIFEGSTFEFAPPLLAKALHWLATVAGRREVCFFLVGASFHLYRQHIPHSGRIAAAALVAVVIASLVPPWLELALPAAFTYLVFYLAYHPGLRMQSFGRHGDISYGIYLYGWPLQQLLTYWFEPYLNGLTLFLVTMPLLCVVAFVSFRTVERPFMRLKRRAAPVQNQALAS
jgi:peptidoglycan/LPS O-acetylase OafA/YrhL